MSIATTQASGVYRRKVGDVLVTALNDGGIVLPDQAFPAMGAEARAALLHEGGQSVPFATAVNAFLLQWPSRTVLIDTGVGTAWGDAAGKLPANMAAAGIAPDDVQDVVLTHLHSDHFGGLVTGSGAPTFPDAALWVGDAELAFWEDDVAKAKAPEFMQGNFAPARAAVAPYTAKLHRFAPGEILPGLEAISLPGHTPGHTGFLLTSDGEKLLIWGDILHLPIVQAAHPEVGVAFDSDPALAERTRRTILERAVDEDLLVTGMHMSFPGLSHIRRAGAGYVLLPEAYRASL